MQCHHVASTSVRRRFNVMCLLGDRWYEFAPRLWILYGDKNGTYVFWPCSLLIVRCPLYRQYSINGRTIYFCCFLPLTLKNQVWTTREGFLPSVSILPTSAPSHRLNDKVKRPCASHELVLTCNGW